MGLDLGNIMDMAKSFNLTDEQKAAVKNAVKTCGNNKEKIAEELKKHNINISADQIDTVIKLVDKL